MLPPEAPSHRIATGLSALGLEPHVKDHDDHLCIETDVSGSTSVESWGAVVALLESADTYGLVTTADSSRIAWAAILKDAASNSSATGLHEALPPAE
ncbi:hypothetical protein GCM10010440_76250 [Kitasatospora cinereorecta]